MVLQTFLGVVFAKNRASEVGAVRREHAKERRQTLLCRQSAKGGRAWQGVRFATGRRVHRSLWDSQKSRKDPQESPHPLRDQSEVRSLSAAFVTLQNGPSIPHLTPDDNLATAPREVSRVQVVCASYDSTQALTATASSTIEK